MPAYFDINLQFLRKDLYPGFMRDFDAHLEQSGLRFKAGYWNGEGFTQAEIAAWNQQKLEADFELSDTEHYTHGYKQALYSFGDAGEIRGYWMNRYPERETFTWALLLAESRVLVFGDSVCCEEILFQRGPTEELLELAKALWQFPLVRAIQTELELGGPPISWRELRRGMPPNADPFAIVERNCHPYDDGSRVIELTEGRPGLLLLEEDRLPGPVIRVPGGGVLRLEEKNQK